VSLAIPAARRVTLAGTAGTLEAVVEAPATAAPSAFLVVCHPHPLYGGTMDNKVVTTLARAANELGAPSIRFNYRGVGASVGDYDAGRGEVDDAITAVAFGRQQWPDAEVWMAGFSFGGVVALRACTHRGIGKVARLITVAPAFATHFATLRDITVPGCPWLVVQGDADEVIDARLNLDWAAQLSPPPQVVVLAGTGHFFHGQLPALRTAVLPFLQAAAAN
jgi:alpha/beta superfamily hydrolase